MNKTEEIIDIDGEVKICGLVHNGNTFSNIVIKTDSSFLNPNTKEIIYATEFSDVESLMGFEDLDIIEIDRHNPIVSNAAAFFFLERENVQAIVFLKTGFLVITDWNFPTAYTYINKKETPYSSLVESTTYEEGEAWGILEFESRLM